MPSLSDDYEAEVGPEEGSSGARVDFDGETGVIDTGPVDETFNPTDYDAILRHHDLDPAVFYIVGPCGFSTWDQWGRDRQTNEWTNRRHRAYKFRFAQRGFSVDLPALYAELKGTRAARTPRPATGESTVVVCWADIQVGKVDHLGGLRELLERLRDKRAALKTYLHTHHFDHIVIAEVGDIVEGFSNTKTQLRTNSLSMMDQVDVAATEFWKTIKLCERYAPVDVLSVPSNHGQWRVGMSKELAGTPTDDWGLHISKRLERQNAEIGLRVSFHRPLKDHDEHLLFDIRGTRLALAHGHQVSRPGAIIDWWTRMTHAGVIDAHVLLTGHFHFASLRPSGRDAVTGKTRWHIQAPTLDNGSAWVRNKLGEDGDPALAVFHITDEGFDLQSFALL